MKSGEGRVVSGEITSSADYSEVCRKMVAETEGREFSEQDALALVGARYEFLSKIKEGRIRNPFGTSPVEKWKPTLLEDIKATLEGNGWNSTSRNTLYIALNTADVFDHEAPAIKYLKTLWEQAEQAG